MIYVTSDIHGFSFEKFMDILSMVNFSKKSDWLYILGNVIDYGTDGLKYLNWLTEQGNVQLILGNHESMLLGCSFIFDMFASDNFSPDDTERKKLSTWMKNGGEKTISQLRELYENDPEQVGYILEYLREECPLFDTVETDSGEFLLVHSGFSNFEQNRKLSDYSKKEILWHTASPTDRYYDNVVTVFGHTPTYVFSQKFNGKCVKTPTWIDIATGCETGNAPMLLRLDDLKEFYF